MSSIILKVHGEDDYGALAFEQHNDPNDVAKELIAKGENSTTYEIDGETIFVSLHKFDYIDPKFIEFVRNFIDYDDSKHAEFYVIENVADLSSSH